MASTLIIHSHSLSPSSNVRTKARKHGAGNVVERLKPQVGVVHGGRFHVSIRPTDIRRVANAFVAPAIFMVFVIDVNAYNIYITKI